ncbi:MAG: hypothetical protein NTU83_03380 [Candidatus Hydrogenedentes bacterium]|nr:hypothetical protein [Candidatus Hydrogenedentota bacterium]
MKHHRVVTRVPREAIAGLTGLTGTTGTTGTTGLNIGGLTGSTPLEVKVNFSVMMVDRVITYAFQKTSVF